MRIVIDLQGAQTESRYRGIGRYTLSLTQALLTANRNHEITLLLNGLLLSNEDPLLSVLKQWLLPSYIKIWYAPGPVNASNQDNQLRTQQAELIREACIQDLEADVILIPSFFEGFIDDAVISIKRWDQSTPVAVCMLDLIPLLNAKDYLEPNPSYKAFYLDRIEQLRLADSFLAISESSKLEAEQHVAIRQQPVINASIAVDNIFVDQQLNASQRQEARQQLGIDTPFILYTGGADIRKNLPTLIQAYALLPAALRDTYILVLAGRIPAVTVQELQALVLELQLNREQVLFTGYVSDDELVSLYNTCQLFVFPSWHEGFGLPALEAIRCGAPTLVADRSSLPEVVGESDALFDPFDPADIAGSMQRVLCDPEFRDQLCVQQKQHSKVFNWEKTAQLTLHALEELHSDTPSKTHMPSAEIKHVLLSTLLTESLTPEQEHQIVECVKQTFAPAEQRTLWVDVSELRKQDARTGIQRVTRSLLQQLLSSPPQGFQTIPVYGDTNSPGYKIAEQFLPHVSAIDKASSVIVYQAGDIFLGLDLQHHVSLFQAPFLWQMQAQGVHIHFVVYDLLPILLPETFPPGVPELHAKWLRHIVSFDQALCISKTVSQELQHWLEQNSITVQTAPGWFHLGADIHSSQPSYGLPDNYLSLLRQWGKTPSLLNVGTLEPRKGQTQALDAFEQLWAKGLVANLILIGKQGWQTEDLVQRIQQHPELNQQLFWLDNASDEFLEKVYPVCSALLATSLGEGFGLPLLEAQIHQLPIIARDLPVFREVLHNQADYFSGQQANDLATVIVQHLKTPSHQHSDTAVTPTLTWQGSAQQLIQLLITKNTIMPISKLNATTTANPLNHIHLKAKKNLGQLESLLNTQVTNDPFIKQLLEQALQDFDYSLKHNYALEHQLQQQTTLHNQQETNLNTLQQHNQQLQNALQAEQQLNEIRHQQLQSAEQQLQSLAPRAEQADALQQQLHLTLNSHSWKMTAPLRFLSGQIKICLPNARSLARWFLAQLILGVEKIPRVKHLLLNVLAKSPKLYQHLLRFKQHRLDGLTDPAEPSSAIESEHNPKLSPSSADIYARLKQKKTES